MDCRRLAYLSACGKYFVHGASSTNMTLSNINAALEPITYLLIWSLSIAAYCYSSSCEALQAYLNALLHINSAAKSSKEL